MSTYSKVESVAGLALLSNNYQVKYLDCAKFL